MTDNLENSIQEVVPTILIDEPYQMKNLDIGDRINTFKLLKEINHLKSEIPDEYVAKIDNYSGSIITCQIKSGEPVGKFYRVSYKGKLIDFGDVSFEGELGKENVKFRCHSKWNVFYQPKNIFDAYSKYKNFDFFKGGF